MVPGSDEITIDAARLQEALQEPTSDQALFDTIVNAPFTTHTLESALMFLGIVVLLLVNKKTGNIDRIALSSTELAKRTTDVSAVPFNEIRIGVDEPENIIATAIRTGEMHDTTDWNFLFTPALTPDEARINQANAGIAYSAVHPFTARDGGALIFSYYQYKDGVGETQHDFMKTYTKLVSDALTA
ncbi:MAG TPA: hypothetical protein VGE30_00165 [Candidatus Saccharimonadales bacterium]